MKRYWIVPILVAALGCARSVPPRLVVNVGSAGDLSLGNQPVTAGDLTSQCARHRDRFGLLPVLIRGQDNTRLADVYVAVHAITLSGLGEIAYATPSQVEHPPPRFPGEWEPEPPANDALLAPRDYLCLPIEPGEVGASTSLLQQADSTTKVLIACADDAPLRSLLAVLHQCRVMNIETVCVSFGWTPTGAEQSVGGDSDKAADGLTGAPQR